MSKKTLVWLLLLLLGVFIFFCIKTKISDMMPLKENNTTHQVQKVLQETTKKQKLMMQNSTPAKPQKVQEIPKKIQKKDISFKIDKSADEISIDGVLNSKDDFINLASKYKGLKKRHLKYNSNAENTKIMNMLLSLNSIFDKFKNGYIDYHDGLLTLKGLVASKEDKELIDATLKSIKGVQVNSNIVVEEPKNKVEHIGKLSITKQGDEVTISGIFSSEKEIDDLIKLLKSKNLKVKKELCIVDSDLKEDRWKVPFVLVFDDFVQLTKGTIQFDKDTFSVIGETQVKGVKEDIASRLVQTGDDVVLTSDITYIKPKNTKVEIQEKINSILKLKSVRFKTATGALVDESKPILDEVAKILLANPDVKVEIAGHTDSDGEAKSNLILSQHRADTVRKYLIKKGVKAENLKAIGYGEGRPLVKNNSEKNKQINRRVEFIILGE